MNSHALSAPELEHLSRLDKRPVEDVIRDLAEAGMGSVPGAGSVSERSAGRRSTNSEGVGTRPGTGSMPAKRSSSGRPCSGTSLITEEE